jgi:hypothetical protein
MCFNFKWKRKEEREKSILLIESLVYTPHSVMTQKPANEHAFEAATNMASYEYGTAAAADLSRSLSHSLNWARKSLLITLMNPRNHSLRRVLCRCWLTTNTLIDTEALHSRN